MIPKHTDYVINSSQRTQPQGIDIFFDDHCVVFCTFSDVLTSKSSIHFRMSRNEKVLATKFVAGREDHEDCSFLRNQCLNFGSDDTHQEEIVQTRTSSCRPMKATDECIDINRSLVIKVIAQQIIFRKPISQINTSGYFGPKGPLLETSRIEYFYLFQIVASENPSLGVVLLPRCLRWTSLVDDFFNKELTFRHFTSNIIRVSVYMKIFGLNNLHDYKNKDETRRE